MPETAPAEHATAPQKVDLRREAPAVAFLALLFLASIGLAVALASTFDALDIRAFEDPENLANPLVYLGIVLVFTLVILLIAKYAKKIVIKILVLGSILVTIYYLVWPLLGVTVGLGDPVGVSEVAAGVVAVGLTVLLWFYPEWYVIDSVGVAVAAVAAGIFGVSFGLLPALVLLVAFAVYDAIAVYRTRHMLSLADSVLELRLPIMFVVPKTRGYSFLKETRQVRDEEKDQPPEEREAMFMGLGDAVIPGILVVSSVTFLETTSFVAGMASDMVVAGATVLGSLAGFAALMYFVLRGNPQAGLPLLNGGAILGFLAALLPLYGVAPLWPF